MRKSSQTERGLVAMLVTDRDAELVAPTLAALSRSLGEAGVTADLAVSSRRQDRRARMEVIVHRPKSIGRLDVVDADYDAPWTGSHRESHYAAICGQRNALRERARAGGYDWLLFLDSDVVMAPDTLVRLLAVPGSVVHAPYRPRWSAHPMVGVDDGAGHVELLLNPHLWPSAEPGFRVAMIAAGCTLIRAAALDVPFEVGSYLFMRGEDIGYSLALRARGETPWCVTGHVVEHRCGPAERLLIPFLSDDDAVRVSAAELVREIDRRRQTSMTT